MRSKPERRFIYRSKETCAFGSSELELLGIDSSLRNLELDVTGILFYNGGIFLQLLEGPSENVQVLASKIRCDSRHEDFTVILDEPAEFRWSATWLMSLNIVGHGADLSEYQAIGDGKLCDLVRETYGRA